MSEKNDMTEEKDLAEGQADASECENGNQDIQLEIPDEIAHASVIQDLKAQLAEANERVLREQAELENFRRRKTREIQEERRYSTQPLITDLLPVVDNVKRAIEAAEKSDKADGLLEGFKIVAEQLESVFEKHHCPRIKADGTEFDPALHEAIGQQSSEDHPPGTVLTVAVEGFQLHERVVRPAQVIISAAAKSSNTSTTEPS